MFNRSYIRHLMTKPNDLLSLCSTLIQNFTSNLQYTQTVYNCVYKMESEFKFDLEIV